MRNCIPWLATAARLILALLLVALIVACAAYGPESQYRATRDGSMGTGMAEAAAPSPAVNPAMPGATGGYALGASGAQTVGSLQLRDSFVNSRAQLATAQAARAMPGATPSPDEELWVIQKGPQADQPATPGNTDDQPGSGALVAQIDNKPVPIPLKHTDVKAAIAGYIATVDVTQQFHNPYSSKIEAVYVFPLPENAGINEFVMTVGQRKIRGIIREREEAEKIYQEARSQGYVASLLTQERPNIFTQKVANIEPGKQIDIAIRYYHTLAYHDGWYQYVFPMVVGPRYNPADITDGVGAVARGAHGLSGQKTEVQYLRPTERSGHDISLQVEIDAGVKIEDLESPNHRVVRQDAGPTALLVKLDERNSIPNRDFVLRYKVAGNTIKSGLMVHRDAKKGNYFTLMIYPPEDLKSLPRRAVEMVFVIDTSGSMSGRPIEQAKAGIRCALKRMQPDDTFQIVQFDSSASTMAPAPLPASAQNVDAAMGFLNNLHGSGGTEMLKGINKALDFPHDDNRTRVVPFLTDGYIGNEVQILAALHAKLADSRVFSFGVGQSVNRYLLDSMAKLGNGAVAYLGLNDDADKLMAAYFERISHPAMSELKIDFGGMKVEGVYPSRTPDLFVGRPVILTGKFAGTVDGPITVRGKVGREDKAFTINVTAADAAPHPALPAVWARMKIGDLCDRAVYEPQADLVKQVKETALEYSLMSAYTAFVAVDSLTRTAGDHGTSVAVPVPVPEGVRYDTTVQEPK